MIHQTERISSVHHLKTHFDAAEGCRQRRRRRPRLTWRRRPWLAGSLDEFVSATKLRYPSGRNRRQVKVGSKRHIEGIAFATSLSLAIIVAIVALASSLQNSLAEPTAAAAAVTSEIGDESSQLSQRLQQQEQFQRYKTKQQQSVTSNGWDQHHPHNQQQQSSASNQTARKPYWRRPGCHLVGHTRTISIPGCVKFNLSTNACRGFCMSYSLPVAADLGPIGSDSSQRIAVSHEAPAAMSTKTLVGYEALGQTPPSHNYKEPHGSAAPVVGTGNRRSSLPAGASKATSSGVEYVDRGLEPALMFITDENDTTGSGGGLSAKTKYGISGTGSASALVSTPVSSAANAARPLRYTLQQLQQHLSGRHPLKQQQNVKGHSSASSSSSLSSAVMRSPAISFDDTDQPMSGRGLSDSSVVGGGPGNDLSSIAGSQSSGTAASGALRDIVSVGQCCNMMETEDVFVNLRCGTNETRRLKFRSAKTCECFFCKHVI